MTAQHTPRPWRYNPLIGTIFAETETGPDAAKKTISIVRVPLNDHEMHANARLIAAAPMLATELDVAAVALTEAAILLRGNLPGCADIMDSHAERARAAIAKATGDAP